MSEQDKKSSTKEQLQAELDKWQTKLDEAKLQMHLGAKDAQDALEPHVEQLEKDLQEAKTELEKFSTASAGALGDLQHGFKMSVKSMQQAFDKAQAHFKDDAEK